jgi:hypothetical protein
MFLLPLFQLILWLLMVKIFFFTVSYSWYTGEWFFFLICSSFFLLSIIFTLILGSCFMGYCFQHRVLKNSIDDKYPWYLSAFYRNASDISLLNSRFLFLFSARVVFRCSIFLLLLYGSGHTHMQIMVVETLLSSSRGGQWWWLNCFRFGRQCMNLGLSDSLNLLYTGRNKG